MKLQLKLYAHNSTYDGSFMLRLLMNLRILEKDSKYVSLNGTFCNWKGPEKEIHKRVCQRLVPANPNEVGRYPQELGL